MNFSENTNLKQKLCLVTVSNRKYWPGTKALLNSFLFYNNDFKGDIIVITNDKNFLLRNIRTIPHKISLMDPSDNLLEKIARLQQSNQNLASVTDRFLKLECFRIDGYDVVVYADSDIIFKKRLNLNFLSDIPLSAALDPWYFRGYKREKHSLEKIPVEQKNKTCYDNFYNSGFMIIGKKYLNMVIYEKLVNEIDPVFYSRITDILADEPIINKILNPHFKPLHQSYNVPIHLVIQKKYSGDKIALHYTGKNKPWKPISWVHLLIRNPKYLTFLILWLKTYLNRFSKTGYSI